MSFPSCDELGTVTLRLFLTPWKERESYGEPGPGDPAAPVFPTLSTQHGSVQALGGHSGGRSFLLLEIMITIAEADSPKLLFYFKFQESKPHTKAAFEGGNM